MGKIFKIIGGIAVILIVVAIIVGDEDSDTNTSSSSSKNTASNEPEKVSLVNSKRPQIQHDFVIEVQQAQVDSKSAENDMQKGGIKATRDKNICKILTSMRVSNWTGWIASVDSNSEGKGVLSVKLAKKIRVTTWNNAFSDMGIDTLLEPGTELFNTAASLKKHQEVLFSGSFMSKSEGCIEEQSMTLNGKINDPEYTFKFSSISALN